MTDVQVSAVVDAKAIQPGGHYSVRRLDLKSLGKLSYPIMGFDRYRMSGKTFSPRPHAGYSIITYVLEQSVGALKIRDSLNNDLVVESGDLVWTQASSGLVHDEFPVQTGIPVDGLQIFVNMTSRNKRLAPKVSLVKTEDIPVIHDPEGNRIRMLCGGYLELDSGVDQAERFDLLEVIVERAFEYTVPTGRNFLIYVLDGSIETECTGELRLLNSHQAVAGTFNGRPGTLKVKASVRSQILVMSGTDPRESIATYGSFILNNENEINEALDRYRNGEMGRLLTSQQ
ncbi:pirin family protein [Pseudomonas fluorescens]|uniref:pirin family protein n=1 Tax=Pseudomonas fluorescens TaxID=294 RepID=UPI003F949344